MVAVMKALTVLGATGSIGRNTLKIVQRFPDQFIVRALTAKSNVTLLAEQIKIFKPELAVVFDANGADRLKELLPSNTPTEILMGPSGYEAAAAMDKTDMVVAAMVGAAGLAPVLAAVDAGKDVALANKETLVMAGALVMDTVRRRGVNLLPVDSEHSAIFQCLLGNQPRELDKIILTASGGPFLRTPAGEFEHIEPRQALKHPNWQMGAKITIDSATLMNKGLEVIEAKWLFDVAPEQIEVMVHPQSIVHSMVAYCDGSIIAQMGIPDMQGAIAYALSHPRRLPLGQPLPDLKSLRTLTFEDPDLERFPCLSLAITACRCGGTMPAVLNAANEIAVHAFLAGNISFPGIARVVQAAMDEHDVNQNPDLDTILGADARARKTAQTWVEELKTISYNAPSSTPRKKKE